MAWFTKKRVHPKLEASSIMSISSSQASLSPSQLDVAITDMLNIMSTEGRCQQLCRGNPITTVGKRKQLLRMTIVVMTPVLVLLGMTANSFVTTLKQYRNSATTREILHFSLELGTLIHRLQEERDFIFLCNAKLTKTVSAAERDRTTLFVANNDYSIQMKQKLFQHFSLTDEAIQNMSMWYHDGEHDFMRTKDHFIFRLNNHRYQLNVVNMSALNELAFYTDLIRILTSWLYKSVTESNTGYIWRSLVGYLETIISKESSGQERALGLLFFSQGTFPSKDVYLWFCSCQDDANVTFESARRYSPFVTEFYVQNIQHNTTLINNLTDLRRYVRTEGKARLEKTVEGSVDSSERWYDLMTDYLDLLLTTQRQLAQRLNTLLNDYQQQDIRKMVVIAVIFTAVIGLCPAVITSVYALTSEMQKYSVTLAQRTKALTREKKRTEILVNQMLPRSVAEQLRDHGRVPAETFSSATVFFSDIQGFTEISAISSPVQVVDMLNLLYSSFDSLLTRYDVYKVETIGDAYMVVSGCPRRNGDRHVREICIMSLDVLSDLKRLEIPHMPGRRYKMRIGVHTGPVAAGVVGIKMPRYCLFGDTVSIAAKMESLGKAGRVHVSGAVHDILEEEGGFVMEERDDNVCQLDPELRMFFSHNLRTYWLTKRTGQSGFLSSSGSRLSSVGSSDGEHVYDSGHILTDLMLTQSPADAVLRDILSQWVVSSGNSSPTEPALYMPEVKRKVEKV